jgi:hypothetical protein
MTFSFTKPKNINECTGVPILTIPMHPAATCERLLDYNSANGCFKDGVCIPNE